MINENFVFNLIVVEKILTKSLKSSSKIFDFNENIEVILSSMIQIIHELKINNYFKKFVFESSKSAEELINNNKLLLVNEFFINKIKNYFQTVKNKKEIMTRAEKAKTKFIKRDSFDFEYVKINFCRDDRDDRDERNNKKIKKSFANIVTIIKADIQVIEKTSAVINRNVQAILTRVDILTNTKAKAKTNINNNLIVNIDKTIIDVSNNKKFEVFIIDEEVMKEVMNIFR